MLLMLLLMLLPLLMTLLVVFLHGDSSFCKLGKTPIITLGVCLCVRLHPLKRPNPRHHWR